MSEKLYLFSIICILSGLLIGCTDMNNVPTNTASKLQKQSYITESQTEDNTEQSLIDNQSNVPLFYNQEKQDEGDSSFSQQIDISHSNHLLEIIDDYSITQSIDITSHDFINI